MSTPKDPQQHPKRHRNWWKLNKIIQCLLQPPGALPAPIQRRSRLLMMFLLVLFMLALAILIPVLIVNDPDSQRRGIYLKLILAILFFLILSYGSIKAGHYQLSAGLLVAIAMIGPWGSIILDPEILQGDFVPLIYIVIPILLSSMLLPISITLVVAAVQTIALIGMYLSFASMLAFNWVSFLAFIVIFSLISILSNAMGQKDLKQIEDQNKQLEIDEVKLRELTIRDHLTGLFNRRYLDEILAKEVQRAARTQHPVGIVMIDIDHFKEINDVYGHEVGDQLVVAIAEIQKDIIRTYDAACRYGGDEFVLIFPEISLDAARERAELIRTRARQLQMESFGQNLGTITISAGVAVYPDHGLLVKDLLQATDEALYQAKQTGRDRVVVAG
jgi:diguanylate cyclase (GGDEF)-like protein